MLLITHHTKQFLSCRKVGRTNLCSRKDICQSKRTTSCSTVSLHCWTVGTNVTHLLIIIFISVEVLCICNSQSDTTSASRPSKGLTNAVGDLSLHYYNQGFLCQFWSFQGISYYNFNIKIKKILATESSSSSQLCHEIKRSSVATLLVAIVVASFVSNRYLYIEVH